MVFSRKRMMNFTDNTPAKGASCGNMGRGPLTKNLVIPKELAKRLMKNVVTESGISLVPLPWPSLG